MQGNASPSTPSRRTGAGKRYWLTALLTAMFIGSTVTFVQATPSNPGVSRTKLRQINADILQARRQLGTTQQQQSSARKAIKDAEAALADTHAQLDNLARQQRKIAQRLNQLDQQAAGLQKEREQQQQALAEQLAALYRLGHEPQLKLLLEQRDPTRIERYQHYFNALDHARNERLAALQRLDAEVATNHREAEKERKRLATLVDHQKTRERILVQQQSSRQQALSELAHSYQSDQARLQSLTQEREQAEAVIEQIERAVAAERARVENARQAAAEHKRQQQQTGGGAAPSTDDTDGLTDEELNAEAPDDDTPPETMSSETTTPRRDAAWNGRWPVDGHIIASFRQGDGIDKNGMLIAAPAGTPIHAMASGQVVFADWLNGFGYLVIIDHGKAMTVYAHNQRNSVATGDRIRKGTIVGTVGDTGGRSSPALHFEVRRQGRPIDPVGWVG